MDFIRGAARSKGGKPVIALGSDVDALLETSQKPGIPVRAGEAIGTVGDGTQVAITDGTHREVIWDFAAGPLIGCAPQPTAEGRP